MEDEFDLSWQDVERRGLPLRCYRIPSEREVPRGTIVCVPGFSASGRSFARLRPLARDFELHFVAPPLDVSYPGDPVTTEAEVVAAYLRDFERPVLLGTSFGGLVSIRAASLRGSSLGGLVLIGAFARGTGLIPRALPFMKHVMQVMQFAAASLAPVTARVVGGRRIDRAGAKAIVEDIRAISAQERARRLRSIFRTDLTSTLREINAPSLIIHGRADRMVPVHLAREMAEALPDTLYHEISSCGHLPYVTHADRVLEILGPFLDRVMPQAAVGVESGSAVPGLATRV
jgi:pimeloyl-ACP methyl ester carboxylesterase